MSEFNFTSGDVVALTGVPQSTLDQWCRAGVVRPAAHTRGTGHHRAFDLLTVVAVAYANRWRALGWGGAAPQGVVEFVTGLGWERLEEAVAAGRTFLHPPGLAPGGARLTAPPVDADSGDVLPLALQLDLGRCVQEVRDSASQLSRRPPSRSGRRRGSAARTPPTR